MICEKYKVVKCPSNVSARNLEFLKEHHKLTLPRVHLYSFFQEG